MRDIVIEMGKEAVIKSPSVLLVGPRYMRWTKFVVLITRECQPYPFVSSIPRLPPTTVSQPLPATI